MSKTKFPITVRRGNVRVKIYHTPSHGCDSFTVVYYHGGKRQRRAFSDLELARQEAEVAANKICAGELDVLTLTSADRTAYVRSMEMLKPLGTPLEMVVMQFVEAEKLLQGRSLLEAAKFYTRHHPGKVATKRVSEAVDEMVEAKKSDGLSDVYVRDLKWRLGRFADTFKCPINMVLAGEIQDYLRSIKGAGRSRNNTRKGIQTLFHYAQSRGYLPKGMTEADDLPLAKENSGAIAIFTPAEMAKLLTHADENLIPFLAIGAFAGLRHAELKRLDWSEVDLVGGHIEVKAEKAKTASRRLVPIPDNLRRWLAPRHEGSGKMVSISDVNLALGKLTNSDEVKVKWRRNGLRHSFISYRVAEIQNVPQVALEAGNSPKVIFSNYRELVKPADAVKWFSIVPEMPANVMPAPMAMAVSA